MDGIPGYLVEKKLVPQIDKSLSLIYLEKAAFDSHCSATGTGFDSKSLELASDGETGVG